MFGQYYVYAYLDPRKPGLYVYDEFKFNFEPFYIGKGKSNRMFIHLQNKNLSKNSFKSNKINKLLSLNLEPIITKVINKVNEKTALSIEEKLIRRIGTYLNSGTLTNIRIGGPEKDGYKHNYDSIQKQIDKQNIAVEKIDCIENRVIKEYNSIKLAAIGERCSDNFIINCCKGRSKPKDGYDFRYKNISLRKKYQEAKDNFKHIIDNKTTYHFDSDYKLIGEFKSIREAARSLNISRHYISNCCNNKVGTSKKGCYFSFTKEYIIPQNIRLPKRGVVQMDLKYNIIAYYESISEASRITKINRSGINAVLCKDNIQKTAGGYIWKSICKSI